MSNVTFNREVPVRHHVDVFVAGAGPAGIAAALAAARQGRSVFLAEGQSSFGGMATAGLLPLFMPFGDSVHFYAGGIGREVYDLLYQYGATGSAAGAMAPTIKAERLMRLYDDLIAASGIGYGLMTNFVGVQQDGPRVTHAVCWGKSGLFAVEASAFVDGTGDGDLCAWAGAPFEKGDEQGRLMPGTLCSLWAQIDWEKVHATRREGDEGKLPQAIADGVFTIPDLHLPGMFPLDRHLGGGNIGHLFGVDGTDERSLTESAIWGRKSLEEYERYYKTYYQGFGAMELVSTAPLPGIRESRRIMGDYVLSLDSFHSRAVFADEIGRYSYPVDIHAATASVEDQEQAREEFLSLRYQPGDSYGIPYRCLLPRGLDNVLVAGRCLSSDRGIQSSLRVMPGCFITGQAAGVAAAMAAADGSDSRAVDVSQLQHRLKTLGAFLPNS